MALEVPQGRDGGGDGLDRVSNRCNRGLSGGRRRTTSRGNSQRSERKQMRDPFHLGTVATLGNAMTQDGQRAPHTKR